MIFHEILKKTNKNNSHLQMQPVMAQGVPMSAAGGAQSTVGMAPPPMMHGQPIMYTGGPANAAPQYHVRNSIL